MAISPRTADNRWHIAETTVAVLAAVTVGYLTGKAPFPLVLALGFLLGCLSGFTVLGIQTLVRLTGRREPPVEPPRNRRRTSGIASSDGSGIARRDEEILREIVSDR